MELVEMFNDINKNTLKPIYIFTGDETAVQRKYIEAIKLPKVEVNSVEEVIRMCTSTKLLSNEPKLYVVFDAENEYLKQEKSWVNLRSIVGKNTLIIKYLKLDKRSKFYKYFQDNIVEFQKLDRAILQKHILKAIDLTYDNVIKLIDITDSNYNLILIEINKITNFAQANNMGNNEAFEYLFENNCLSIIHGDVVMQLKDAYLKRDIIQIQKLSVIFKQQSESIIYLLSLLYTAFKQQLIIEGALLSGRKENIGYNSWQIKKSQEVAGNYTLQELKENLLVIRTYETAIKAGIFTEEPILDFLYLSIIGKEKIGGEIRCH